MIRMALVLGMVIVGVMALAPEGTKRAPHPTLHEQLGLRAQAPAARQVPQLPVPDPQPSAVAATKGGAEEAPALPGVSITPVTFTTPAPAAPVGTRDAPHEVLARLPAQATPPDNSGATDILFVVARRVNLRRGPSTDTPVIGTFARGTRTRVVSSASDGWIEIRDTETGLRGFMARKFLSARAP